MISISCGSRLRDGRHVSIGRTFTNRNTIELCGGNVSYLEPYLPSTKRVQCTFPTADSPVIKLADHYLSWRRSSSKRTEQDKLELRKAVTHATGTWRTTRSHRGSSVDCFESGAPLKAGRTGRDIRAVWLC